MPEPGNPQALNRYAYVLNNPIRYTDPTGHAYECGVYAGTSCADVGPKFPVEIVQAPPDALDNVWAVTEFLGAVISEPVDWGLTARDFLTGQGSPWALVGLLPLVPSSVGKYADEAVDALRAAENVAEITNPLPRTQRFARAVPEDVARKIEAGFTNVSLARPGDPDVFITAAEDLARYRTQSAVERRLALPPGPRRAVVTFKYNVETGGIATPILRDYPEFVGRGRTAGGAREWVIPNRPLRELPIWDIKIRYLK